MSATLLYVVPEGASPGHALSALELSLSTLRAHNRSLPVWLLLPEPIPTHATTLRRLTERYGLRCAVVEAQRSPREALEWLRERLEREGAPSGPLIYLPVHSLLFDDPEQLLRSAPAPAAAQRWSAGLLRDGDALWRPGFPSALSLDACLRTPPRFCPAVVCCYGEAQREALLAWLGAPRRGTPSPELSARGYVAAPGLLTPAQADSVAQRLLPELNRDDAQSDPQVEQAPCAYGHRVTQELLHQLWPELERLTGRRLCPSYSYVRLYRAGMALTPHRDRPACEFSCTLTLAHARTSAWSIAIRGPHQGAADRRVQLGVGDGLVYMGCECLHWREALARGWWLQCFLHYVDVAGPHYPSHAFDQQHAPDAQRHRGP